MGNDSPESAAHQLIAEEAHYSGPIPPPAMLDQFERIHPGLANRIVAMAERGVEIQHDSLKYQGRAHILGQIFAFTLTITTLCLGGWLLYNDKDLAGLVSLIAGIGVIINSIVRQNKNNKNGTKAAN